MSREKAVIREPDAIPVPPAPEAIDLEIDENDDLGSDPYNRTGSHCVLQIGDDD